MSVDVNVNTTETNVNINASTVVETIDITATVQQDDVIIEVFPNVTVVNVTKKEGEDGADGQDGQDLTLSDFSVAPEASTLNDTDRFLIEQGGVWKSIKYENIRNIIIIDKSVTSDIKVEKTSTELKKYAYISRPLAVTSSLTTLPTNALNHSIINLPFDFNIIGVYIGGSYIVGTANIRLKIADTNGYNASINTISTLLPYLTDLFITEKINNNYTQSISKVFFNTLPDLLFEKDKRYVIYFEGEDFINVGDYKTLYYGSEIKIIIQK